MKKTNIMSLAGIGMVTVVASATVLASPAVAPFTDNLQINVANLPQGGAYVSYQSDTANRVNINGSTQVNAGNSSFRVHISSNYWSNGYPSMRITLPTTGEVCNLVFVDGALVSSLDFKEGVAPNCGHLKVSAITQDGQYNYHMNVTY